MQFIALELTRCPLEPTLIFSKSVQFASRCIITGGGALMVRHQIQIPTSYAFRIANLCLILVIFIQESL
jgi:hypothetical protein